MVKSEFFLWAKKNEWNINLNSRMNDLSDNIKSRYNIPKQWYDFISEFDVCETPLSKKFKFKKPEASVKYNLCRFRQGNESGKK